MILLDPDRCYKFTYIMANSADPDLLASEVGFFRSQLIWIYTACKGRIYPGSAGQGLIFNSSCITVVAVVNVEVKQVCVLKIFILKIFIHIWFDLIVRIY